MVKKGSGRSGLTAPVELIDRFKAEFEARKDYYRSKNITSVSQLILECALDMLDEIEKERAKLK